MTSTTSSIRKNKEFIETYIWALKKNKGIGALLALLMFMAMPMLLMIMLSNRAKKAYPIFSPEDWVRYYKDSVIGTTVLFVIPLILIFTILISVLMFGYMHQKRSVDLFHSLPVKRTPMMLGRLLAAFTLITVPVLLNFAITIIVGASYSINLSLCLGNILSNILWIILISTASLIFMALMAVCTGTTFDMIVSALGVNIGYPLFIFFGNYLITSILPGYGTQIEFNSVFLTALSPLAAAFLPVMNINNYKMQNISPAFFIWWLIFTIILLVVTIALYKRRKSECAEFSFAFPLPKIVIRFLITAVAGLAIGLALGGTGESINFFIGLISGSIAAHIVVEAVYSRGFKSLKKSFVYYGLFLGVFFIVYAILATGCFGYDTRVPQAEEVESINVTGIINSGNSVLHNKDNRRIGNIIPTIKESKNIKAITEHHKKTVLEKHSKKFPYCFDIDLHFNDVTIKYNLKNGKALIRSYPYTPDYINTRNKSREYNNFILEIEKLKEFRKSGNSAFYINAKDIKSINIELSENEKNISPDLKTKEKFLKAWRQDISDGKTPNRLTGMKSPLYYISIEYKNPIKNKKLKEFVFVNNYKKDIYMQQFSQAVYPNSKVAELINKLGWDK